METTFTIPSISCSTCSNKIQNELKDMNGVENININLKTQNVKVTFNQDVLKPQDITRKIASMGYEVIQ